MRFLVDECTGPAVAGWLKEKNHNVVSVYDESRGMDDDSIIQQALFEKRILITNDKDFGEKVFREAHAHKGVILLRLADERTECKIRVLSKLLEKYGSRISGAFLVVTERRVRFVGK